MSGGYIVQSPRGSAQGSAQTIAPQSGVQAIPTLKTDLEEILMQIMLLRGQVTELSAVVREHVFPQGGSANPLLFGHGSGWSAAASTVWAPATASTIATGSPAVSVPLAASTAAGGTATADAASGAAAAASGAAAAASGAADAAAAGVDLSTAAAVQKTAPADRLGSLEVDDPLLF